MKQKLLPAVFALGLCVSAAAQVNSGSNGGDGPLDYSSLTNLGYATNIVINLADHPTGIYQYTYVNIPANVTVTFIPNANNTPVTWLVQSNVVINGTVDVSGKNSPCSAQGALGGPGGWAGGNGGSTGNLPIISNPGFGPGGGTGGYFNSTNVVCAGQASFGTVGNQAGQSGQSGQTSIYSQAAPGNVYGNIFLMPLLGGSGGGGLYGSGGGGGGGAILIAANGYINVTGYVYANGGFGAQNNQCGMAGGGS